MRRPSFLSLRSKKPISPYNALDKKLVQANQKYFFPRWSQLKYVHHFLNKKEKQWLAGALSSVVVGGVLLLVIFASNHITQVPTSGGDYSEALIGEPKFINPLFSSANDVDADLVTLIYAGLFRYNKQQKLEPWLAKNYSVSADQKTYTIELRPELTWSDGKPLTSNDVIYTFELIENPEIGSPLLATFQGIKVEKINNSIIRFVLKEPFAPFLSSLTVGIIPEHIWGDSTPGGIRLAKSNLEPIGAGPWQFSQLLKGSTGQIESYALTRNEKFFGEKPYLQTMEFKFFNDYGSAVEALRGGTVNALSFVPRSQENKLQSSNLVRYAIELPQYTALFFNQSFEPLLKNDNLRLALAEAIDKKKLVAEALGNDGTAIDAPLLKGSLGYNPNIKPIDYSKDAANILLDKQWTRIEPEEYFKLRSNALLKAYQNSLDITKKTTSSTETVDQKKIDQITQTIRTEMSPDQTFYRRDKNNNILELTITTVDTPEYIKAAELVANMWQKIGVRAAVNTVSSRQIVREVFKNRNYQVLLYGEIIGSSSDPYPLWHSSQTVYPGLNIAGFSNRAADKLLEDARTITDEKKRNDLYKKFQDVLLKDLPAIFLYTPHYAAIVSNNIKGIAINELNAPNDRFAGSAQWYSKTRLQWK